jgi:hypothetical protein
MPFIRYMHEVHALPAALPLTELLLGARDATLLRAHLPSARRAVAATLGFGIAWLAFMLLNVAVTGVLPYPFMVDMAPAALATLIALCYAAVAAAVLALRAAVAWRAGGGGGGARRGEGRKAR